MPKNIIIVGSSNTDMIIKTPRIPKPGETILGGRFTTASGGKGANQAVAAARAGGHVTFVACVGNDSMGKEAVAGFIKDHINIDYIKTDPDNPSGVALIFVDEQGENSIAVSSGANSGLLPEDIQNSHTAFKNADIMLAQLETPLETIREAVLLAHENNITTILNPAPAQQLDDELLGNISILTPNASEAELLTGIHVGSEETARIAAAKLLEKGVGSVIITMGAHGSFISTCDGFKMVPAFNVKAVDSTAAGDVFNGALAVALSQGNQLYNAVVFANAAAALSVTRLGAQPSAPYVEEIKGFLHDHAM